MNWFRFYSEAAHDPKVQNLKPDLFKAWVNLLCLASQSSGDIPSIQEVAYHLRSTTEKASKYLETLESVGLLDRHNDSLRPHNWDKRQFKSDTARDRMRLSRLRHSEVTVTPRVRDQNRTEQNRTDTEQNRTERVTPENGYDPLTGWARFEQEYPGEVIPDRDCRVWLSIITTAEDEKTLWRNLPTWKLSRKWQDGFIPSAQNFLFDGHWKVCPREPVIVRRSKLDEAMEGI